MIEIDKPICIHKYILRMLFRNQKTIKQNTIAERAQFSQAKTPPSNNLIIFIIIPNFP